MDFTRGITSSQIEYVLFHWGHHIDLTREIRHLFRFSVSPSEGGKIYFPSAPYHPIVDRWSDDQLPVIFPVDENRNFYSIDSQGNLVFHVDVLKTIFFLLSGWQEVGINSTHDKHGRFNVEDSIQFKGGWVTKPLVNYYFDRMTEGLAQFCELQHLRLRRKKLFENFAFLLSHDIDRVDYFTWNEFLYSCKELAGVVASRLSIKDRFRRSVYLLFNIAKNSKQDPFWNFRFLIEEENKHAFTSSFYFLNKGVKHADAYHSLDEPRMRLLFEFLKASGREIAMHGSSLSKDNVEIMTRDKRLVEVNADTQVVGNRQHRLLWHHPSTAIIARSLGIEYDTTLGFAGHEGFRNSYCHPFKLFDFEKDQMIDLWEFPLNIMDVTLYRYRKLSHDQALASCMSIVDEVIKFNGCFSLLWHNSFFDEITYPGITNFYTNLLASIAALHPESFTGGQLLERLKTRAHD